MEIVELLVRSAPEKTFALSGADTVMALEEMFLVCRLHQSVSSSVGKAKVAGKSDRREAGTLSLQHQVVVYLLGNLALWARAPPALQFGLAARLVDLVRDEPTYFRSMVSMEAILTNVKICCPHRVPDDDDQTVEGENGFIDGVNRSETISSEVHGRVSPHQSESVHCTDESWTRMACGERRHMRGCLWEAMRLLLEEKIHEEDGPAVIHFLVSCDDTQLVRTSSRSLCDS